MNTVRLPLVSWELVLAFKFCPIADLVGNLGILNGGDFS